MYVEEIEEVWGADDKMLDLREDALIKELNPPLNTKGKINPRLRAPKGGWVKTLDSQLNSSEEL